MMDIVHAFVMLLSKALTKPGSSTCMNISAVNSDNTGSPNV